MSKQSVKSEEKEEQFDECLKRVAFNRILARRNKHNSTFSMIVKRCFFALWVADSILTDFLI